MEAALIHINSARESLRHTMSSLELRFSRR
jgi:hypothetical protein